MKYNRDEKKIKALGSLEFEVTQRGLTEKAFHNTYWNHSEQGIYVDIVSGEPLFSSKAKYDAGTGWPSFYEPIDPKFIVEKVDYSLMVKRIEVRSKYANSHLGHVFKDGPKPTNLRYSINSASLKFIPKKDLSKEGYSKYLALFEKNKKTSVIDSYIILAGGCFWGVEGLLRKFKGILHTEIGYTGGSISNPSFEEIKTGTTGHAEAIKVVFDTRVTDLKKVLHFFFKVHNPTKKSCLGKHIGPQYRSAIFVRNNIQEGIALDVIDEVNNLGRFPDPVITTIEKENQFYSAEKYYHDYLIRSSGGYTCNFVRN